MLPTPVDVTELSRLLTGYDEDMKSYIISGFTDGFKLGSASDIKFAAGRNSLTVNANPSATWELISKELAEGRIAGPFDIQPFKQMQISPISLRPKSTPGKFRLIQDLAFPYNKDSVNQSIPSEFASVKYSTVRDAISHILQMGPNAFLAKVDIESAFRLVPVHPTEYPKLGFMFGGKFFYDRCLTMGCRSSCKIFETIATALEWILTTHYGLLHICHYIDDFIIIEPSREECGYALATLLAVFKRIGIPVASGKNAGTRAGLNLPWC